MRNKQKGPREEASLRAGNNALLTREAVSLMMKQRETPQDQRMIPYIVVTATPLVICSFSHLFNVEIL